MKFAIGNVENIVEKKENAGYQHFLIFTQCFQKADFAGGGGVIQTGNCLVTSIFLFSHSVFKRLILLGGGGGCVCVCVCVIQTGELSGKELTCCKFD